MKGSLSPASRLVQVAPLIDAGALVLAGYLAWCIRFSLAVPPEHYLLALLLALLLGLVLLPAARAYQGRSWHRPLRGLLAAVPGLAAVFAVLMLLATLTKTTAEFSRLWMGMWVVLTLALLMVWRALAVKRPGRSRPRILLVGSGQLAADVARRLRDAFGDDALAGFIRVDAAINGVRLPAPILGDIDELDAIVQSEDLAVSELWLATELLPRDEDEALLRQLRLSSLPVRYVPDLRLLQLLGHRASDVAGMTVIDLNATPLDGPDALIKSVIDRVAALFLLVALSPLLAVITLAIKIDSPGPALFSQSRHGGGGRVIRVFKFRSMRHDDRDDSRQARRDDPRVTRVGRVLRKTSLDELPQLLNVLRGEMSLVGPRPHPLALNEAFSGRLAAYMQRHRVKPGITGLAQINGLRGETDTLEKMEKRLEYDLEYIENWSLWLDVRILARTVLTGWIDRNAY